jgi:hypothetical protein
MFIFQTVCSDPLHQVALVVRCIPIQRRIYLLSQPLSSHAKQAVVMEGEPFTSPIAVVNVFWIKYVVMIVIQQVLLSILHTYGWTMGSRARITSIIHQLYDVLTQQHHAIVIHYIFIMEKFVVHQLIYPWTKFVIIQELCVTLTVIPILSHVHWHIPHLQTTLLIVTIAFI